MKIGKRDVDETLFELICGILLFAVVCQLTVVWLVERKVWYSFGLWIGVAMAVAAAVHMYRTLDTALDCEAGAEKILQKNSMLRYLVIVVLFSIMMITRVANPLSAFLGLMGLKVAAYIQPFTHKWIHRKETHK